VGANGPTGDGSSLGAPADAATSVGAHLRVFRTRAGLSQEALAERAGLGVATLKALERDHRQRPHLNTLVLLAEALGLAPADRDALLESTLSRERPDRPALPRPIERTAPSAEAEASRLPIWLSSFVGREVEVETVRTLLDPSTSAVRLLTLLGPGGVGKTRLAIQATLELVRAYADGVVFVDLAPLADPRFVPATIARAHGIRETSRRSARDLLLEHLRPLEALLILDNFEHLLAAAPLLADLLRECPRLALLVTSRTPLRLRAERRFRIVPLATPALHRASFDEVTASPAVRLFVERAKTVAPEFALESSNAAAVAEVCRRLDGMPLAIELAAARAGLLQPAALLQRLERRLPLLTRGAADLPERQQTLRHTLAWSLSLLGPAEQALFRRLAVFAGGCTLDAVEAVCQPDPELPEDLLEQLGALVDGSLVHKSVDTNNEPRFGMLETVREYAEERLAESAEVEATRRAHARFYLELAEQAVSRLGGPDQAVWLRRMEHELANLRAALDWLIERGDLVLALRLATAATWYWAHRAYFSDAQRLIRLLRATEGQGGPERAAALLAAARLASTQADYGAQARYDAEATRLFRDVGDSAGTAEAVTDLGAAMWQQGRLDEAEPYLEEGLRLFRALADSRGIAAAVLPLANLARDRGDFDAARPLYAEVLALRRAARDELWTAHVLNNLGWLELYAGHLDAARKLVEESLAIRRALGTPREAGVSQTLLGKVALCMGEPGVAGAHFAECLATHRDVGNPWGIALALEGVAGLVAESQPERALRLAAAAEALRLAIGRPLPPAEQPLVAGWLAPAQSAVSADNARRARAEGEALSQAQAVAEALELTASVARG